VDPVNLGANGGDKLSTNVGSGRLTPSGDSIEEAIAVTTLRDNMSSNHIKESFIEKGIPRRRENRRTSRSGSFARNTRRRGNTRGYERRSRFRFER
jgi:hypothetical protein